MHEFYVAYLERLTDLHQDVSELLMVCRRRLWNGCLAGDEFVTGFGGPYSRC